MLWQQAYLKNILIIKELASTLGISVLFCASNISNLKIFNLEIVSQLSQHLLINFTNTVQHSVNSMYAVFCKSVKHTEKISSFLIEIKVISQVLILQMSYRQLSAISVMLPFACWISGKGSGQFFARPAAAPEPARRG